MEYFNIYFSNKIISYSTSQCVVYYKVGILLNKLSTFLQIYLSLNCFNLLFPSSPNPSPFNTESFSFALKVMSKCFYSCMNFKQNH